MAVYNPIEIRAAFNMADEVERGHPMFKNLVVIHRTYRILVGAVEKIDFRNQKLHHIKRSDKPGEGLVLVESPLDEFSIYLRIDKETP